MCRAAIAMTQLERKGSLLTSTAHQPLPGLNHRCISGQNLKINFKKEWSLHSDPRVSTGWIERIPLGGC